MTLIERLGRGLLCLLLLACAAWAGLALFYAGPAQESSRYGLVAAVCLFTMLTLAAQWLPAWHRIRWWAVAGFAALFGALLFWYFSLQASNDRDWRPEVAVLPFATVDGNSVTVHNIRNFDYRSEHDFTPAHYERRFDLNKIEGVDVVTTYWMGPHIAHVFLSFAFADDQHLAFSIETRTEKGEGYSTLRGFFRQYELFYTVADERDVIRVRTNYRKDPIEDVYVYRVKAGPEGVRRLFMEYVRQINELKDNPAFYNSLTTNCTTNMWVNARINPNTLPFSWKVLASGHVPEYLYEQDRLVTDGLSLEDLQAHAHVNSRAQAADSAADFSRRIRLAEPVAAPAMPAKP
ncbi:Lnb N-terminal periplasmic domain-containing protein [Roseateles oligotrophus]|uniref:DUF4105 domain-containing protein n=1 Tax=Roseateles oligotrophus TaxID=1769250 RepID=A0ABT2YLV1_9BURK|nr:DUF4105 domain-containing protein [Roseateles oligotrophus]MCV2371045.1 DUF4105 domain-containing protein [Roseateles oligotrophus]